MFLPGNCAAPVRFEWRDCCSSDRESNRIFNREIEKCRGHICMQIGDRPRIFLLRKRRHVNISHLTGLATDCETISVLRLVICHFPVEHSLPYLHNNICDGSLRRSTIAGRSSLQSLCYNLWRLRVRDTMPWLIGHLSIIARFPILTYSSSRKHKLGTQYPDIILTSC